MLKTMGGRQVPGGGPPAILARHDPARQVGGRGSSRVPAYERASGGGAPCSCRSAAACLRARAPALSGSATRARHPRRAPAGRCGAVGGHPPSPGVRRLGPGAVGLLGPRRAGAPGPSLFPWVRAGRRCGARGLQFLGAGAPFRSGFLTGRLAVVWGGGVRPVSDARIGGRADGGVWGGRYAPSAAATDLEEFQRRVPMPKASALQAGRNPPPTRTSFIEETQSKPRLGVD